MDPARNTSLDEEIVEPRRKLRGLSIQIKSGAAGQQFFR